MTLFKLSALGGTSLAPQLILTAVTFAVGCGQEHERTGEPSIGNDTPMIHQAVPPIKEASGSLDTAVEPKPFVAPTLAVRTAVSVAVGSDHTCVLVNDGAVRCWGNGAKGKLGYGNTNTIGDDETPAAAGDVPLGGVATQVEVGDDHTCALLVGGTVRCWGDGSNGKLGYGNTTTIGDDETPASAGDVPLGGKAVQIAVGGTHTCALLDTGNVRCWGQNGGALGYGYFLSPQGFLGFFDVGDDETPESRGDVPVGGQVTQIAAASGRTCAVTTTGGVRCWGSGLWGANGNVGANCNQMSCMRRIVIGDDETPALVGDVPVGVAIAKVAMSSSETCGQTATGEVRCWGWGFAGKLGYGNTNNVGWDNTPASAGDVSVGASVSQLAVGGSHVCALQPSGAVRCWGWGPILGYGFSPVGNHNIGDDELPSTSSDVQVGGGVTQIAATATRTCVVLSTGSVRCWGYGDKGLLGYGPGKTSVGVDDLPASAGDIPLLSTAF